MFSKYLDYLIYHYACLCVSKIESKFPIAISPVTIRAETDPLHYLPIVNVKAVTSQCRVCVSTQVLIVPQWVPSTHARSTLTSTSTNQMYFRNERFPCYVTAIDARTRTDRLALSFTRQYFLIKITFTLVGFSSLPIVLHNHV